MRYTIVDSHRNWKRAQNEALMAFFTEGKGLRAEEAEYQCSFLNWYEKEYSVKCFEAVAYDKGKVVGYMRCYRDPQSDKRWFVGDIYVLLTYRKKSIGKKLYDRLIDEVIEYEAAECLEASVSKSNEASIALHESMGFSDTQKSGRFASFYFPEDESIYRLMLYKYYPLNSFENAKESLEGIWERALLESKEIKESSYGRMTIDQVLEECLVKESIDMETIWNGNKLVGITIENREERLEYQIDC